MRLISLHVRNYRIHLDTRVEFDAALNLVGGPNESGKSTLLEAAHRALFLNHRRGGSDLDSMQTKLSSAYPEVELEFEQGGVRYFLRKRFQGTRAGSHAELSTSSHDRWSGVDAETKLAQLLGYNEPLSAALAIKSWAHLWIRQGSSGSDPTDELNAEQATLLTRLQHEGGAALMRSQLDSVVGLACAENYAHWFTGGGAPKAGSELKTAETTLVEKERLLVERSATAARLESAIQDHERATRQRDEAIRALPELEVREKDTVERIAEANRLKEEQAGATRDLSEARKSLSSQTGADQRIRELADEVTRLEKAIEPLGRQVAEARSTRSAAEAALKEQARQHETAVVDTRRARYRRELVQQLQAHYRTVASLRKSTERLAKINAFRKELAEAGKALAGIPDIKPKDIEQLRQLTTKVDQAQASLESIAAGIEWIDGVGSPTLDGTPLTTGEPRVITEPCDLDVAGNRFRIRPGGGRGLEEVRETLSKAESALRDALERLGVDNVTTANLHLEERRTQAARVKEIETKLEALDPEETEAEISRLGNAQAAATAEISRLRPLAGEMVDLPEGDDQISDALGAATSELESAESTELMARGQLQAAQERSENLVREMEKASEELATATKLAGEVRVQHETLVKEYGEQAARRERITSLQRSVESLEQREAEIVHRLKALQPEHLESDLKRHRRAITAQQELRDQAKLTLAATEATLKSDGTTDPYVATIEARQAVDRAREDHTSAQRRAEAIRLLHQLFEEENQRLSDQLTEPLAARISDYLQCLFGPQARARVHQNSGDFHGLELIRPGGPFRFDELSGGTREQLAAAVRLAMAELLAEEHGGCLPVVFDDAFTNCDAERILGLQRMLDFAATRGLQIVVLTCAPAEYASLGARTVPLEPVTATQIATTGIGDSDEPLSVDSPAGVPRAVSQPDIDTFLTALRNLGGKAGNQSLRESLGWEDEGRYTATKDYLAVRGDIVPGRGRGGSVSLS